MKQRGMQVLIVAVAVLVIGWLGMGKGGPDVVAAEGVPATPSNTVTVGANGSVMVEPDVAYLNLAVETRGAKATDAQKANADRFAAVEKTLYDTFGIDKKDVKTTGFRVQPEYNYTEKEGQVLKGYVAIHSIQVTYRKLPEIGKLLDALSAAGANRMDGVQFDTEKTEQYELEALKKAMANASAKANVLAASANRQLKGVVNIVQGSVANSPVYKSIRSESAMDMGSGAASSVQSGQIEITTSVTVQYDMQ
jgi:uncharacterized protein